MDRELMLRGLALGVVTGLALFGAEDLVNFALFQPPLTVVEVLTLAPLYAVLPALIGGVMGALGARNVALAWWIWAGTGGFLLGGKFSFQLMERGLPGWPGFPVGMVCCGVVLVAALFLTRDKEQLRWGALAGAWVCTVVGLVANLNALASAFSAQALAVDFGILVLGGVVTLGVARMVEARTPDVTRITALVAVACWLVRLPLPTLMEPSYPPPAPRAQKPPVLLIVVDTLRADHLGAYGYDLDITPNLDRLAAKSFVYTQAMSGSSWTLPSFASILTGLEPEHHGAGINDGDRNLGSGLSEDSRTFAGYLRRAGYTTGAIVTNAWLKSLFGLDRGFDYYDDSLGLGHMPLALQPLDELGLELLSERAYTPAERQADKAIAYVRSQGRSSWLLMVHFMDPHGPYTPPERHLRGLPNDYADPVERFYDAEIRYADEQIGRLLASVPDNAWVIVTSDHGEEFGDHPDAYAGQPVPPNTRHGHTLYEELVRVPLIVFKPRNLRPGLVDRPVRTTDILPTLLEVAGVKARSALDGLPLFEPLGQPVRRVLCEKEAPPSTCGGTAAAERPECIDPCPRAVRDLYEALDHPVGTPVSAWPSVAEALRYGQERKALRLGSWKLIHGPDRDELYNLSDDPSETNDLLSQPAEATFGRLPPVERAHRLGRFLDADVAPAVPVVTPTLDSETQRQLRELGYIE